MNVMDEIVRIFEKRGAGAYFGEPISMNEHALQAAYFAKADGAPVALVVAALLHDVGHLIDHVPDDIDDWVVDAHHEEIGSRWLAERFGREVSEPVRLHVPAKRFLCATDAHYAEQLSPASVVTLKLQGGPMSPLEIARFEAEPYYREAVRLRRWDDLGKIEALATPGLMDYRSMIESLTL